MFAFQFLVVPSFEKISYLIGDYFSSRSNEREVHFVLEFDLRWLSWIVCTTINDERIESVFKLSAIRSKDASIPFGQ
jgi:hypothetical protein